MAGVRVGDIILAVDGNDLIKRKSFRSLRKRTLEFDVIGVV